MHPLALRIAPYAALAVLAGATGWTVNGWRLEARISSLKEGYATTMMQAEQAARKKEQELNQKAADIKRKKDAEIAGVNSALQFALGGVRDRPSSSGLPRDPANGKTTQGCDGTQLFRDYAELALREAARADTVRSALLSCYQQYDSLRP